MGRKPKEAVEAMSNSLNEMRREFESDFLGVRAHEEAYSEAMCCLSFIVDIEMGDE